DARDLRVNLRERRVVIDALTQAADRAARLPVLDFLTRSVAEIAHALGVRPGAVGLALQQCRAATATCAAHRLPGGALNLPCCASLAATSRPGGPYDLPRLATLGFPAAYSKGPSVASWLFSHTNSTGNFQMPAMFSAS